MERARRLLALVLAVAAAAMPAPALAQASETSVKAAFLPRFARYVTWPAGAWPSGSDPVVLCVVGPDPFGAALDRAAASQSIDGKRIVIRRINSAAAAGGCNIAFVRGGHGQSTADVLAALGGKPILTVTDASSSDQRGMIHFTIADGRVRFYIDQAKAMRRGLSISSRLLALAIGVNQR